MSLNDFEIEKELGKGTFGSVYLVIFLNLLFKYHKILNYNAIFALIL